MDAAGEFVETVGKKAFYPYFADTMVEAFDGIKSRNPRLSGCCLLFLGVMGRMF